MFRGKIACRLIGKWSRSIAFLSISKTYRSWKLQEKNYLNEGTSDPTRRGDLFPEAGGTGLASGPRVERGPDRPQRMRGVTPPNRPQTRFCNKSGKITFRKRISVKTPLL